MEAEKQNAYIKKLILKNYKKFEEAVIEFTPGLNILVGPNNAGKTTILEAIDILLGEKNLSRSSVKRSHFHKFNSGTNNSAKLILEITYPISYGKSEKEVNFIKQLKMGKGSSASHLACGESSMHLTTEDILSGKSNSIEWTYSNNLQKSGFSINTIFLVTHISVNSDFEPEVTYDIYMNVEKIMIETQSVSTCYKVIGVSGTQRAAIFNYLFLPANRINNKSLTEITDFNWLGRYLRKNIKKNSYSNVLSNYTKTHAYPGQILDTQVQKILNKLFTDNVKNICRFN